jgi:hypothetical protein
MDVSSVCAAARRDIARAQDWHAIPGVGERVIRVFYFFNPGSIGSVGSIISIGSIGSEGNHATVGWQRARIGEIASGNEQNYGSI